MSYHGEPEFKLCGETPLFDGYDLRRSTLHAIRRDTLPALIRSDSPACFNPLVMLRRLPELYSSHWDALRAHLGSLVSVTFEFEGQRAQRTGTLSLAPRMRGDGEILALTAEDETRATFAPDLGATISHAALCYRGFDWQRGAVSEPGASEIVELRGNIPKDISVYVTDDETLVAQALWRGIDDRYLPLIAIEAARSREKPGRIFSRPLRNVRSIRTAVPLGQVAALRDIWPQPSI